MRSLSSPKLKYDKIYLHPLAEKHTLPAASKTNRVCVRTLAKQYTLEPHCDDTPVSCYASLLMSLSLDPICYHRIFPQLDRIEIDTTHACLWHTVTSP